MEGGDDESSVLAHQPQKKCSQGFLGALAFSDKKTQVEISKWKSSQYHQQCYLALYTQTKTEPARRIRHKRGFFYWKDQLLVPEVCASGTSSQDRSGCPKLRVQLSYHLPVVTALNSKALKCICTYKFSAYKSPETQQFPLKAFFVLLDTQTPFRCWTSSPIHRSASDPPWPVCKDSKSCRP